VILELFEPDALQQFDGLGVDAVPSPLRLRSEEYVVQHAEPREQRGFLEADTALRAGTSHGLPEHENAPARRGQESGNEIEDRGFSTTTWTKESDELPVPHLEGDAAERGDLGADYRVVEDLGQVADIDRDRRGGCGHYRDAQKNFRRA
jgi:hypothetical protein